MASILDFEPRYDDNKKEDTIYIGKRITKDITDGTYRSVQLIISQEEDYMEKKENKKEEFKIRDVINLYKTDGGQQKIACWLLEDVKGKYINGLHISRRTDKGLYSSQEITLNNVSILKLREFLNRIYDLEDKSENFQIPLHENNKKIITEEEFNELIKENVRSIDDFYKLISIKKMELNIQRLEKIISGEYKNEVDIQKFLKSNLWMFGNEYSTIIENGKINSDNILDVIPKNLENFLDIIEVKLPQEKMFNYDESHNNYYPTSHLTKAISQIQNYIFELEKKVVDIQYQENNSCKIIRPRGIILYGSEQKLNSKEQKFLRILNSSYHNVHILTYQQLLEKAKNIMNFIQKR